MSKRILIADDELVIRTMLVEVLTDAGYQVVAVADGAEAIAELERESYAILVTDVQMPRVDGITLLKRAREIAPQTPVLVITAQGTVETAVEALRYGAADYLLKPLSFDDLLIKVARLLEYQQLVWEAQMMQREIEVDLRLDNLIAQGPAMRRVVEQIRKVAPTDATVLLTGENGTGKEVVARAIHAGSLARARIFLPVNCAAIPADLLESQLFGHLRGAFTGATHHQEGLFTAARGGTIFLDEIGELPLQLQGKLLRAIEAKEVTPLGATVPAKIAVRIIAATNRDLPAQVAAGKFREDLYFRLNVVEIHLPPLRERREDIASLVDYLISRHNRNMKCDYKGVDAAAMQLLLWHRWPGNVRELDNAIEHGMIFGDGETIRAQDLPSTLTQAAGAYVPATEDLRLALQAYERMHIEAVLRRTGNDKKEAARLLGLSLSTLYRKLDDDGHDKRESA